MTTSPDSAPPGGGPAVDHDRVEQLRQVVGSSFAETLRSALDGVDEARARITEAAEHGDSQALAEAAHAAKGLAATFGAAALAGLLGELEQRSRAGESTDGAALAELDATIERTRREYAGLGL